MLRGVTWYNINLLPFKLYEQLIYSTWSLPVLHTSSVNFWVMLCSLHVLTGVVVCSLLECVTSVVQCYVMLISGLCCVT